jgi:hypothetical protein
MTTARRPLLFVGSLALLLVAACVSTVSQTGSDAQPSFTGGLRTFEQSDPESIPLPPPATGDVTGTWDGSWQIDPPYETVTGGFVLEIVQSGDSFTGPIELTNTDCPNGTVTGTVQGSNISFGWLESSEGIEFVGTTDGRTMSGTWSSMSCSGNVAITGTWEATKR